MVVVRENRVPLGLGWVAVIFGVAVGIIYALAGGEDFAGLLLIEVPTFLAGILLFMDYFLRRLTIEDNACCYRTMFGRCRFFAVQDIKSVRLYTHGLDAFISLIGEQEQLLARLESNMIGTSELLTYLEKRKIPIRESEKPPFGNLDYYEDAAKDGEQFYQTHAWKKVIRILRNLLAVTGILLFLVTWLILCACIGAIVGYEATNAFNAGIQNSPEIQRFYLEFGLQFPTFHYTECMVAYSILLAGIPTGLFLYAPFNKMLIRQKVWPPARIIIGILGFPFYTGFGTALILPFLIYKIIVLLR